MSLLCLCTIAFCRARHETYDDELFVRIEEWCWCMDVNKLAAVFVFEMYAQQSTESGQHL